MKGKRFFSALLAAVTVCAAAGTGTEFLPRELAMGTPGGSVFAEDSAEAEKGPVITEICFNPTFEKNDRDVSSTEDVFEFVEILNRGTEPLSLEGCSVSYRTPEGTKSNTVVKPEGSFSVGPGEFAVLAVVTSETVKAGYTYRDGETFAKLFEKFCKLNGCKKTLKQDGFFLIPKVSAEGKSLKDAFNLVNSDTDVTVTLTSPEGSPLCTASYNPKEWNRDSYALNFQYTGEQKDGAAVSAPFNVSKPTPGKIFENQVVPDSAGLYAPENAKTRDLTLVEYNVCATEQEMTTKDGTPVTFAVRAAGAFDVVERWDADVVCLCEINYMWEPYVHQYLDGFGKAYASYGRSSRGNTWKKDKLPEDTWDLFNLILWKKSRFRLVESGTFWCSANPDQPGTFDWIDGTVGDFARGINWVILQERATGAQIFVLCQHIDAKVNTARVYSAELIRNKAEELSRGLPAMLTGDWNCGDNSSAYAQVVDDGYFADARYRTVSPESMTLYASSCGFGSNTVYKNRAPIDHCFISKNNVFVRSAALDDGAFGDPEDHTHASDHTATVYRLTVLREKKVKSFPVVPVAAGGAVLILGVSAVLCIRGRKKKGKAGKTPEDCGQKDCGQKAGFGNDSAQAADGQPAEEKPV